MKKLKIVMFKLLITLALVTTVQSSASAWFLCYCSADSRYGGYSSDLSNNLRTGTCDGTRDGELWIGNWTCWDMGDFGLME